MFLGNHPGCKPGQAVGYRWARRRSCLPPETHVWRHEIQLSPLGRVTETGTGSNNNPHVPECSDQLLHYTSLRSMSFIKQMDLYSNENCKSYMKVARASSLQAEHHQASGRKMKDTTNYTRELACFKSHMEEYFISFRDSK